MTRMITEADIKRSICEWLEAKRVFFWVQVSGGRFGGRVYKSRFMKTGVPDILGIWNNAMLAIEVKKPGGRVSDEQAAFIEAINNRGGTAFVAFSLNDVTERLTKKGD